MIWRQGPRRAGVAAGVALACLFATSAEAFDFLDKTHVVNVTQRTRLHETVLQLGDGGYALAGGGYRGFRKWYEQRSIDIQFDFMTELSDGAGLLWGFGTGERGEKYRIAPSFKIGFIVQKNLNSHSVISFSATRLFGGKLKEKPCVADYGEIGGVQLVNCRLAASELEPSATLQDLVRKRPEDW